MRTVDFFDYLFRLIPSLAIGHIIHARAVPTSAAISCVVEYVTAAV